MHEIHTFNVSRNNNVSYIKLGNFSGSCCIQIYFRAILILLSWSTKKELLELNIGLFIQKIITHHLASAGVHTADNRSITVQHKQTGGLIRIGIPNVLALREFATNESTVIKV